MRERDERREGATALELLQRFLGQLTRLWALVLAVTVLTGAVLAVRAKGAYRPWYEARARFSVSSSYDGDDIFSASYYDNAAAQQLATAFPNILSMDLMKDLMLERLEKPYINGTITPYAVANTNMFVLKVGSTDPQDAYDILIAVMDCFPQAAVYLVENPRVDVLEESTVPEVPVNSFSWGDAISDGLVKGVGLGLALVALAAALTKNITSLRQLKNGANVEVLAVFPQLSAKKRRRRKETLVTAEADSGFAEALRGLALKLSREPERVTVVTSTISGEGKTTTAMILARTLSEDGSSVVLVDADLRNQSIGRLLGLEGGRGLLECLKNEKLDVLECLRPMPGADVMVLSGDSAPDWKYAVEQRSLERVLDRLRERFDHVILDASPCAMVADTALLCRSGRVLYVVRCDWARESQVLDQVSALHERDVKLRGFIFNGVPRRSSGYGYGYGYGYGAKYGYGYGYGSRKK